MVFVLVHSPLVGPGTWVPVARDLERRGHQALVPSLLATAEAPSRRWQHDVQAVCDGLRTLSEPIILVGHSGGGLLLPVIADAVVPPVSGLIFMDSGVPARIGETPLVPQPFLDHLRALAVDGILPPWAAWWGEDAMRDLVPDEALRAALRREMPSLPLSYFEQRIPSPPDWECKTCAPTFSSRTPTQEQPPRRASEGGGSRRSAEHSTSTPSWHLRWSAQRSFGWLAPDRRLAPLQCPLAHRRRTRAWPIPVCSRITVGW
jgi:pimeloyl-ACP methyl ester carboxylesterase